MSTRPHSPQADPPRGGGRASPRPVRSGEPSAPAEVAGRWARGALERLVASAGPAASVLLVGEPGTGRRTLARAFHERRCPSGAAPLLTVGPNSAADEDALHAALFGREGRKPGARGGLYWPGAIELARGGTALLVGIEFFPKRSLDALGAYLEEGVLRPLGGDARRAAACAVVATARSRKRAALGDLAGRFDVTLEVPPLRERVRDIEDLFWHFARRIGFGGFPARAAEHFAALPWPGNVPELRGKVEAEAAHWLDSCASPGRSRPDIEREIRESWEPRTVPAAADRSAAAATRPRRASGPTKKDAILALAEQVAKGGLTAEDAARRAAASLSYTRQVLRKAGVDFRVRK